MSLKDFVSLCDERQKIIVSKENKREHIAINEGKQRVYQYRIDGKVISQKTACDFLLMNDDKMDAYLIELKGNKLEKAFKQVEAIERELKTELEEYTVHVRIPCEPRTHAIKGNEYQKFRERHGGRVRVERGRIEEKI